MSSKGRPYRSVRVGDYEVLVGRSDADNDHLTFDVAEPDDLWLHVGGGTPGSHVVIRNPAGGDVPPEVVEQAARLAAWHSKARGAPRVDVHVCRRADVWKARGAPAGEVMIRRYRRLRVAPAPPDASG